MLKAMLRAQWKACWHLVTALTVAAFLLPIVSVRLGWKGAEANLPRFLTEMELWGFFYPGLAAIAGLILGTAIWISDRRGQHVYALLLPLPRWKYVLLRYTSGLALLLPLILALWLGALFATTGLDIPVGLRQFPHGLALKFALVLVLLFGVFFALSAMSSRTRGIGLRVLGLFLAAHIAVILLDPKTNLLWTVVKALAQWPGPLAPLGGRWMLIDV
jgi:ABC-type transport system involved in multi-copper enzyme maturation permease subunit